MNKKLLITAILSATLGASSTLAALHAMQPKSESLDIRGELYEGWQDETNEAADKSGDPGAFYQGFERAADVADRLTAPATIPMSGCYLTRYTRKSYPQSFRDSDGKVHEIFIRVCASDSVDEE